MPQQNHAYFPSGFWWKNPPNATYPRLVFGTVRTFAIGASIYALCGWYRSLSWNYTYTTWLGKSMAFEDFTQRSHEPASVEEIDRLRAEEAIRKAARKK